MSWQIHIAEARPALGKLTPREAEALTDALSAPYIAQARQLPLEAVKTHAPQLHSLYQTVAMLSDAAQGRVELRGSAPDNAWRLLAGLWPQIDHARKSGNEQVREFADRFADAARETFPNRGYERI